MSTDLLLGLLAFHSSQVLFKKHCTLVLVYSDQSVSIFAFPKKFFPKLNPGFLKFWWFFFFFPIHKIQKEKILLGFYLLTISQHYHVPSPQIHWNHFWDTQ